MSRRKVLKMTPKAERLVIFLGQQSNKVLCCVEYCGDVFMRGAVIRHRPGTDEYKIERT